MNVMHKKGFVSLLIIGVILVALGAGAMIFAFGNRTGAGCFGYGSNDSGVSTFNATEVKKLSLIPSTGVKIDKAKNTIEFYGSKVLIPIMASPENGSMYSFGIYGLVNPTIIVHKDAQITVQLVNMDDDMYHGVVITSGAPPYFYMGTMMFDGPAFVNSYIPPLPEEKNSEYPESSTTFTVSTLGTFYYICQVMGHASKGMYGKFVVVVD